MVEVVEVYEVVEGVAVVEVVEMVELVDGQEVVVRAKDPILTSTCAIGSSGPWRVWFQESSRIKYKGLCCCMLATVSGVDESSSTIIVVSGIEVGD